MSDTVAMASQLSRNERLDRLPLGAAHRKLLVASGIGWAFDAMDVGLVSFVVAAIAADPQFSLTAVLSIGFIGMAVGAALGGYLADRVGRKTVFSATLVVFGLANAGMAFSWSLTALLVARLVIGLGLGAELPVASTLVCEFSPIRQRGRMTVLLESFWAVGWIAAACVGYAVIPNTGDRGWRYALLIGALPLMYAIVMRMHIPVPRIQGARGGSRTGRALFRTLLRRRSRSLPEGTSVAENRRQGAVRWPIPRAYRRHMGHVVLRQFLLLRRLHVDAESAGRSVR